MDLDYAKVKDRIQSRLSPQYCLKTKPFAPVKYMERHLDYAFEATKGNGYRLSSPSPKKNSGGSEKIGIDPSGWKVLNLE